MTDLMPARAEAQKLFEEVVFLRNNSKTPFTKDQEQTFRQHCTAVASIAEKIASALPGINEDRAYILGLLHDCGRIKDEKTEHAFHGYIGYHHMLEKGYPTLARISITHNFYQKDFDTTTYPQNKEQVIFCKKYIQTIDYNDYDRLIQLSDILNDMGKLCTIEYRFSSIAHRYNIPVDRIETHIRSLNELKQSFDNKIGIDVYKFLGILK